MFKISRRCDYALLLLTALASRKRGETVSLKDISKEGRMPYKYLSQIAPQLVEAGILGSKEGTGGGYFLKLQPKEVSVGEVLEIVEGPIIPVRCLTSGCLYEAKCLQKQVMKKIAGLVSETIKDYTLADILTGS